MVLVISVWEMTVPTEGATGEYINTESTPGFILLLKGKDPTEKQNLFLTFRWIRSVCYWVPLKEKSRCDISIYVSVEAGP